MIEQEVSKRFEFILVILIFLSVFIAFSKNSYAQEDVIRVDTDLITVPATVMDRNGRYVTNLRKEDFQIFEDGVEQEVALFEPTEQPVTVFLLLDTSKSMKDNMAKLASATNTFLTQLRPNDQLIVASFCDYTKMLQKIASVAEIRGNNKIKLKVCGRATMLYEAVDYAFKRTKKIRGRKAILLFSDGVDSGITTSTLGFFVTQKDNLQDAEELDTLIYTVQFNYSPIITPHYVANKELNKEIKITDNYMKDLAQITGGRHYQVENISNLAETFAQIAQELGQQYSLGYYPKETGKKGERRQIKVKVNIPNVAVRARDSYIVESRK